MPEHAKKTALVPGKTAALIMAGVLVLGACGLLDLLVQTMRWRSRRRLAERA